MKKITGLILITAATLSFPVNAEEIRIAVDGSYAPFAVQDASGTLSGFDIDIAEALCAEIAADCRIIPQPWDGIIPGLKMGKYDAIISSMSITEERSRVVDFTSRYYSNVLAFVGARGKDFKLDKEGLRGLTIGACRSAVSSQYVEDNYADIASIKLYDTQDLAYLDIKAGRIDLLVTDKFPACDWLRSDDGSGYEFKDDDIDINDSVAVAVKKGSPLRLVFNGAIKHIRKNGAYQKINAKYFPFDIDQPGSSRVSTDSTQRYHSLSVMSVPLDFDSSHLRGSTEAPALIREVLFNGSANTTSESGVNIASDSRVLDAGQVSWNRESDAFPAIEQRMGQLLDQGHKVLTPGRDHSITYPLLKALARSCLSLESNSFSIRAENVKSAC